MEFSNFTKTTSELTILLKNSTPIEIVKIIKYYSDNSSGTFSKKEFRWSFNNDYWSSWETLSSGTISNIKLKSNIYLFLEIRYVQSAEDSGDVTTFTIYYD